MFSAVSENFDLNGIAELFFIEETIKIVQIAHFFAVNRGNDVAENDFAAVASCENPRSLASAAAPPRRYAAHQAKPSFDRQLKPCSDQLLRR